MEVAEAAAAAVVVEVEEEEEEAAASGDRDNRLTVDHRAAALVRQIDEERLVRLGDSV